MKSSHSSPKETGFGVSWKDGVPPSFFVVFPSVFQANDVTEWARRKEEPLCFQGYASTVKIAQNNSRVTRKVLHGRGHFVRKDSRRRCFCFVYCISSLQAPLLFYLPWLFASVIAKHVARPRAFIDFGGAAQDVIPSFVCLFVCLFCVCVCVTYNWDLTGIYLSTKQFLPVFYINRYSQYNVRSFT